MGVALWFTLGGVLLVAMALGGSVLSRMPLSTSMFYLLFGAAVSPWLFGLAQLSLIDDALALERLAEVVVLISLFTSGLKLSAAWRDRRWRAPLRLALLSMLVTVAVVAAAGNWLFGLPLGAAILLGGILAPTDPVLASDVQVADATDRDRLRFSLTAEGGLNDGTAFPVVMLGLGLLGLHDLGAYGWRWVVVDVVWATAAGVALGALVGACVGKLVVHLRSVHREATGYDNFLALGCIGLAYGLALLCHAYGFLAVFAAGLALRHAEQRRPGQAPGTMTRGVLEFNEQIDRIGEVAAVVAIGMLLWALQWTHALWWMVPVLLLVARPLAVAIGLAGAGTPANERRLIGWFGIRGVGSLFYLAYALNHGLSGELAQTLAATTVAAICASVVLHGISVTPLMALYRRRRAGSAG